MYPSETLSERYADGTVHILGLIGVLVGSVFLITMSVLDAPSALIAATSVYAITLFLSFGISACYHMAPWHKARRGLRRLDHAAIYALIAGTFTPLLVKTNSTWGYALLAGVWALAAPAMIYKCMGTRIQTRWSSASYLAMGWMGVLALPIFYGTLPTAALIAAFIGGGLYSIGTFFCTRPVQVYRFAIWHSFVLLGSAAFFMAIWMTVFA